MKKMSFLIIFLALLLILASLLSEQNSKSFNETTFNTQETRGIAGYFKDSNERYVFRWKSLSKSKQSKVIIFGDFYKPEVLTLVPTNQGKLSQSNKKMVYPVNIINSANSKSVAKKGSLVVNKIRQNYYSVKLISTTNHKKTKYLIGSNMFRVVKKSPVKYLAEKYSRKPLYQKYKKIYKLKVDKDYKQEVQKHSQVKNPDKDKKVQKKINNMALKDTNRDIERLIQYFDGE